MINYSSKEVKGKVIKIHLKETYTRNLTSLLQRGNHRQINVSYTFNFDNKEHTVTNDKLLVSPSSKYNELKKGDIIAVYVQTHKNRIQKTLLVKPKLIKLIPYLVLFLVLVLVAYLSRNM